MSDGGALQMGLTTETRRTRRLHGPVHEFPNAMHNFESWRNNNHYYSNNYNRHINSYKNI